MVRDEIRYTTLERSVEGLTGGKPVPLPVFENRIAGKIVLPVALALASDGLDVINDSGSEAET